MLGHFEVKDSSQLKAWEREHIDDAKGHGRHDCEIKLRGSRADGDDNEENQWELEGHLADASLNSSGRKTGFAAAFNCDAAQGLNRPQDRASAAGIDSGMGGESPLDEVRDGA